MSEVMVFSAGDFTFGLPVAEVSCVEYPSDDHNLKDLQVQNLNAFYSENEEDTCKVGCWILKKSGDALGVRHVIGLGEVEAIALPPFLKQNIKVGSIKNLAYFKSQIIYLFEE